MTCYCNDCAFTRFEGPHPVRLRPTEYTKLLKQLIEQCDNHLHLLDIQVQVARRKTALNIVKTGILTVVLPLLTDLLGNVRSLRDLIRASVLQSLPTNSRHAAACSLPLPRRLIRYMLPLVEMEDSLPEPVSDVPEH